MHKIIATLFAAAVMSGSASASDKTSPTDTTSVMRPVRQFVDAFNRGDLKTACAGQSAIIDEFPPYLWQGATACGDWSNDFDAYRETNGITDPKITLGLGQYVDITGDRAYVVVKAYLTLKQKGKRVSEREPILTVTLQKGCGQLAHHRMGVGEALAQTCRNGYALQSDLPNESDGPRPAKAAVL